MGKGVFVWVWIGRRNCLELDKGREALRERSSSLSTSAVTGRILEMVTRRSVGRACERQVIEGEEREREREGAQLAAKTSVRVLQF